jgi:3-hydroxyisobutyrate dehydrogenase
MSAHLQRNSVGFIGLGAMGWPMAIHLAKMGVLAKVFDARQEVAEQFAKEFDVQSASSAADCAEGMQTVITIVPTSAIVQKVLCGDKGVARARLRPQLVIEMTSGEPVATRQIAQELEKSGIQMIDAPVSGGVTRAKSAELAIMMGGDVKNIANATPILQMMGKVLTHVGPVGAGQALKALNNLASAAGLLVAAEAISVAKRFGLDAELVVDVINNSSGMNNSTKTKFKPFILSGTYGSGFGLDLMVKDIGIALDLAKSFDAEVPFSLACLEQWKRAQSEMGSGKDHTAIAALVASRVGVKLANQSVNS